MRGRCCSDDREKLRRPCGPDNFFQGIERWLASAVVRAWAAHSTSHAHVFMFAFISGKIDPRIILIGTWRALPKLCCNRAP